jgi:hypothetical protein
VAINASLFYVSVRGDLENEPFILGAENDNLVSTVNVFVFLATGQDAQVPNNWRSTPTTPTTSSGRAATAGSGEARSTMAASKTSSPNKPRRLVG